MGHFGFEADTGRRAGRRVILEGLCYGCEGGTDLGLYGGEFFIVAGERYHCCGHCDYVIG